MDIRLPSITATSEAGQLVQIRSYLYQLTEQLKFALSDIETRSVETAETAVQQAAEKQDAGTTFSGIKSLIIKSADIVNAYYDEINKRLEGEYVALSDFGTYTQKTSSEITANAESIRQTYTNLQTVTETVDALNDQATKTNAYIKTGLLTYDENGSPIYGLEIGQTNSEGETESFDKFARFSSDRLSFYDRNDTEVAYVSDYKLFITNAEVTGTMAVGKFALRTTNGLAFQWTGG